MPPSGSAEAPLDGGGEKICNIICRFRCYVTLA